MSDTSGRMSGTPLAFYDHDSRFWRTLQATLVSDWERYSETLPRWGTTRAGVLYELPMPAPLIDESECSSWLPTPRSVLWKSGAMDTVREHVVRNGYKSRLEECVAMLPTPTVMDMGSNYTPDEWQAWKDTQKAKHLNGNGHGASLEQEALKMLPTPTVQQGRNATSGRTNPDSQHHDGWTLNDVIYAGLIGANMSRQSADGSLSSDEQHQIQPFGEETETA